jgi:hypothetical protein
VNVAAGGRALAASCGCSVSVPELRSSKSYYDLGFPSQSERFQTRGLFASGASFGFIVHIHFFASGCPFLSFTMKHAPLSSIVQGNGKAMLRHVSDLPTEVRSALRAAIM